LTTQFTVMVRSPTTLLGDSVVTVAVGTVLVSWLGTNTAGPVVAPLNAASVMSTTSLLLSVIVQVTIWCR